MYRCCGVGLRRGSYDRRIGFFVGVPDSSCPPSADLLSAIGIAGMDRVMQHNVLAMSGKAVEAAGDVNTLLLDKTGTITLGNRQAVEFIPFEGVSHEDSWQMRHSFRAWPMRRLVRQSGCSACRRRSTACAGARSRILRPFIPFSATYTG